MFTCYRLFKVRQWSVVTYAVYPYVHQRVTLTSWCRSVISDVGNIIYPKDVIIRLVNSSVHAFQAINRCKWTLSRAYGLRKRFNPVFPEVSLFGLYGIWDIFISRAKNMKLIFIGRILKMYMHHDLVFKLSHTKVF